MTTHWVWEQNSCLLCTYAGSNQSCFRKCGPPQKPYETFGIIRGGI